MKIAAHLFANLRDNLAQETGTVLQRAAILVTAVVDPGTQKLREQVTVRAVCFHAVKSGLACAPGALAKVVDGLLNVLPRHHLADEPVECLHIPGRAERFAELILHAGNILLAAGVAQL